MTRAEKLRVTRDLLLVADLKVPIVDIEQWGGLEIEQAEAWATAVHSRASDNPDRVPPKPGFLKKYSPPNLKAAKHPTRSTK
jgi:hypothetical protein